MAVYYNKYNCINILLDIGCNIESLTTNGDSQALLAMNRKNYDSLYILIQRGCIIDTINANSSTKSPDITVRDLIWLSNLEVQNQISNSLYIFKDMYDDTKYHLNKYIKKHLPDIFSYFTADLLDCILNYTYPVPNLDVGIQNTTSNMNHKRKRHESIDELPTKKRRYY